jgi:hypothetical protein
MYEYRGGIPMKASRITSANQMMDSMSCADDLSFGNMAIMALKEFYMAARPIYAEQAEKEPYLAGYLEAYDRVTAHEIQMLQDMGDLQKEEWGRIMRLSGIAYEYTAFDMLLDGEGELAGKKKKQAAGDLAKELQELKKGFFTPPQWVETILKSIIDIFS